MKTNHRLQAGRIAEENQRLRQELAAVTARLRTVADEAATASQWRTLAVQLAESCSILSPTHCKQSTLIADVSRLLEEESKA